MNRALLTLGILFAQVALALGNDTDTRADDERAIRMAVSDYVNAFNQADAKALALLWSPEAVYVNPVNGQQAVGREAIEKQFSAIFTEGQGSKLTAATDSVRFVSPNVAIEQGSATVVRPNQPPEQSDYTAVYVKREGKWLLDRVTEEDLQEVPSSYEKLKELEWMIGTWVDEDEQSKIETTCAWTKNQNFITRSFTITIRDRVDMSGMQIVGWDPAAKQIHSWVFDSDGGFGEGTWTKKGNRWYIHATGVTPDGKKTSAVNIMTIVNADTFTWQSIDRYVDGELLPNVDEIPVVRKSSAE